VCHVIEYSVNSVFVFGFVQFAEARAVVRFPQRHVFRQRKKGGRQSTSSAVRACLRHVAKPPRRRPPPVGQRHALEGFEVSGALMGGRGRFQHINSFGAKRRVFTDFFCRPYRHSEVHLVQMICKGKTAQVRANVSSPRREKTHFQDATTLLNAVTSATPEEIAFRVPCSATYRSTKSFTTLTTSHWRASRWMKARSSLQTKKTRRCQQSKCTRLLPMQLVEPQAGARRGREETQEDQPDPSITVDFQLVPPPVKLGRPRKKKTYREARENRMAVLEIASARAAARRRFPPRPLSSLD
jgi:hypothetical protein